MTMPSGIGIVDTMIGFPHHDMRETYRFITDPNAAIYEVTPDAAHQTVWNMQIKGQTAYRAFRMPSLYPGVQW